MMLIDLVSQENWELLNEKIKNHLALPSEINVRAFRGLSHGVYEITQSLAQVYVHKRHLALVKGLSPAFDFMVTHFLRDSYQIQSVDIRSLKSDEDLNLWVQGLHKDTLFAMWPEDHPVTGEVSLFLQLDKLLNDKKIFSIRVSHHRHFYEKDAILPYSIRICSYSQECALSLQGARIRNLALLARQMYWHDETYLAEIKKATPPLASPLLVESFEAAFPQYAYFQQSFKNRLYDRSVLCFKDLNAEAICRILVSKEIEMQMHIATTSACIWGNSKMFTSWWLPTPSMEELRGLLIISHILLQNKNMENQLRSAVEQIKKLSTF